MLGSVDEADDAVQVGWLRLSHSGSSDIDNLAGWLTTVVARVCLDMLRSRSARREDTLDTHVSEAVAADDDGARPRIVFGFTIEAGKIVEIELLANPEQLGRLDLAMVDD
jgi:RNA polymerase sigma-70 factor (ECF subfamily)